MVWAALSVKWKTKMTFMNKNKNTGKYVYTMSNYFLSFKTGKVLERAFQQDNCSIHTAGMMNKWLNANNSTITEWPGCSPDLTWIETVWEIFAQRVCVPGRQTNTVTHFIGASRNSGTR